MSCPECRHILPGGRKCHQPALRGESFCYHHIRTRNLVAANRARRHSIALPPLEDRQAIQMSLDAVLAALGAGKINRRTAATYAYALAIASENLARMEEAPPPQSIEFSRCEDGDILAAELLRQAPEAPPPPPPDDLRDTCASQEYDEEPAVPPTKTELRRRRRQIVQNLEHDHAVLQYWIKVSLSEPSGTEDPQIVVNYMRESIRKLETELQSIDGQLAPDPEDPDPPL